MTTPLSKEELREFTQTLASEPELLTAFLESMIESVALQANVADLSEVRRDEAQIEQNKQDIATLQTKTSGKQDSLDPLADGQSWVGPSNTPTNIATQAELDALDTKVDGKQDDLPDLSNGQAWVGPAPTPTDIATQAELDAERATRVGQNTELDSRIANEVRDRTNADTALGTRIDAKADQSTVVTDEAAIRANTQAHMKNAQLIAANAQLIATNSQNIAGLESDKHDSLPALGEGEGWLGPGETPTALATQAELDAETKSRTDADALLDKKTGFGGVIGIVPKNIDAYTDLDGNYKLAAYDFDASYLVARNVDQYEIWIKQQAVYTTQGIWTPVSDFIASFEIDTTEETQVGLTANDSIVPVRLVFRSSGSFVDEITTYLTIGDGGSQDELPELGNSQYWATDGSGVLAARDIPTVSGGADTTARAGVARNAGNIASEMTNRQMGDQALGTRIDTLQTRSDDGDEIGVTSISNAAELVRLFGSQEMNSNAAWVYFTADVTEVHMGTTHIYKARDLAYFAPRNIIGKVVANLPPNLLSQIAALTDIISRNVGSIAISPNNIPNAAAIQRDFVFAAEDLDEAWLKSKNVDELEIWFNNTAFHTVDPWTPTADVRLNVNVNATEATAIAVGSATIVPVRAVFRSGGTFVALINSWLTIGEQGGIGSGGGAPFLLGESFESGTVALVRNDWVTVATLTVASENRALFLFEAAADRTASNANLSLRVQKDGVTIRSEPDEVGISGSAEHEQLVTFFTDTPGGSDAVYTVQVQAVTGGSTFTGTVHARSFTALGTQPASDQPVTLTQAQQIGLLSVHPDPSIIVYPNDGLETALTGTIRILVANPELLTGDIWVEGLIDGQDVLARTKWASNLSTLNFVISSRLAGLIGQNDSLDVRLDFYDAATDGTIVESLRYGVSLVEQAAAGAAGATAAQAAAIAANTTGRTANTAAIATERARITANATAITGKQDTLPVLGAGQVRVGPNNTPTDLTSGGGVVVVGNPATVTPEENKVLLWEGEFYQYRPKTLITRDLLGSDFRRPGSNTWGGILTARPSSPPDNVIYYTFTGYGSITANMFSISSGGGTTPLSSGHTPAQWDAYPNLAAATAATNAINRVIIIPEGGFYVTGILPEAWIPLEDTITEIADTRAAMRYTQAEKDRLDKLTDSFLNQIADNRAAIRYTQAEKDKLASLTNLLGEPVQYAIRTAYPISSLVIYSGHLYFVAVDVPASNTSPPVDGNTWILLSADPTPTATTTRQGTVEAATQGEMNSGTANRFPDAAVAKAYIDVRIDTRQATLSGTQLAVVNARPFVSSDETKLDALPTRAELNTELGAKANVEKLQQAITPSATAISVDVDDGAVIDLAMNRNVTLQLTGGTNGITAQIRATQDATGSRTLAFHSSISGKAAPTLTTAAGKTDYLYFQRQGAIWHFVSAVLDV